jgi:hypothetical protein
MRPTGWRDPRKIIGALAEELERAHGMRRIYVRGDSVVGLLSACLGVTVWYFRPAGRVLRWREGEKNITWPAADVNGAAARIAASCDELATRPDTS